MYYSKYFNSNYMEFVVYETCDKLIWTSDKGCRNINTIRKEGNEKNYELVISFRNVRLWLLPP